MRANITWLFWGMRSHITWLVLGMKAHITWLDLGRAAGTDTASEALLMCQRWSGGSSSSSSSLICLVCSFMSLMKSLRSLLLFRRVCNTSRFFLQCCKRLPTNNRLGEAVDHLFGLSPIFFRLLYVNLEATMTFPIKVFTV